ncbi:MAG: hypothetical protein HYU41_06470 [Candidatus Rokubacteria bacterium]|nr:hypothetical protein [Candidatus Rokubacteria bacterium]
MTVVVRTAVAVALVVLAVSAAAGGSVPTEPRARVAHHLREVTGLQRHFDGVMRDACPRFASTAEWTRHFEGEVERVVLLLAHLEQAWLEAKRTGDDDVRRTAKAPRQQLANARPLLGKLSDCADDHGVSVSPFSLWRRIEREVPKRQAEIALPLPKPN